MTRGLGLLQMWRWLIGRYRPERRYMRGPEPITDGDKAQRSESAGGAEVGGGRT